MPFIAKGELDTFSTILPSEEQANYSPLFLSIKEITFSCISISLDGFAADTFFTRVLGQFEGGPIRVGALIGWLQTEMDFTAADAVDFVQSMTADQTLISPLQISLLDPIESIRIPPGSLAGSDLANTPHYALLERNAVAGGINPETGRQLLRTLPLLERLAPDTRYSRLDDFKRVFEQRFDREKVPLLRALDIDWGLSYGDSGQGDLDAAAGLPFPSNQSAAPVNLRWGPVQHLILRRLTDTGRAAHAPLVLRPEEINELPAPLQPLPCSLPVMFRETTAGLWLEQAAGASALQLPGRFTIASDSMTSLCLELAAAEQAANPEVIFADIDCLYDAHTDNINRRLPIYPAVIPVSAHPAADGLTVIEPSDLLLSVQGNELVLESRRLEKRVIPRLCTAFNYQHSSLPLFHLLCDMQFQGV